MSWIYAKAKHFKCGCPKTQFYIHKQRKFYKKLQVYKIKISKICKFHRRLKMRLKYRDKNRF